MVLGTPVKEILFSQLTTVGPQYGLGRHREVVSDEMLKMIMLVR